MREPLDLLIDKVSEIHKDILNKIVDIMDIQAEYSITDEENKVYSDVINLLRKMSGELNVEESRLIIRQSQLEKWFYDIGNFVV